jgi:tetratricopeptide (TPR) repeat protein
MLPARAKLALVDLDLESKMLARRVPIADQVSDAWKREFAAWWTETQRLAGELRTRYEVVVGAGDREVSVAAALRIAQVDRFVTDLLLSSRIPDSLRTGEFADDKVEAYCDALTQAAEPLEQRTVAELASCLRIASAVTEGVDDAKSLEAVLAWSDVCADQLAQLQPDKLHAVNEAFGPRHPLARLHIRLRNFDAANRVLDRAPVDYDVLNAMAINVRHRGDLSLAEYGYRQAIALDEARPEAHFNLALLEKAASLRLEPREALVRYRKAIELFLHAQSRATGELKREVETQLVLATKTIAAIEKFLAAQAP